MSEATAEIGFEVVSPVDGSLVAEKKWATFPEATRCLERARAAQAGWAQTPLPERQRLCRRAVRILLPERAELALELTMQMGRPLAHSPSELDGVLERTLHLTQIAPDCLARIEPRPIAGFRRFIERPPVGVVFAITPWNYPYLTMINGLVPALLAGNSVVLKPSPQVPLCAERLQRAFERAGLGAGVLQVLHSSPDTTEQILRAPGGPDLVLFTGSVRTGRLVRQAVAGRWVGLGLELGGKDPAYVREDANLTRAVEGIVSGALFNAGQSCCAVERVYVHASHYDRFLEAAIEELRRYRLGDPRDATTTLGPLVSEAAAERVREQVRAAVRAGARVHLGPEPASPRLDSGAYLRPQLLSDVDHRMTIMREETFGPVLGLMPVADDDAAIALMNDSDYGLSASIWTEDLERATEIGARIDAGTIFMNRCDYLDPALAWTGVKDSGHGYSLSELAFAQFTRAKSFHLRS